MRPSLHWLTTLTHPRPKSLVVLLLVTDGEELRGTGGRGQGARGAAETVRPAAEDPQGPVHAEAAFVRGHPDGGEQRHRTDHDVMIDHLQ